MFQYSFGDVGGKSRYSNDQDNAYNDHDYAVFVGDTGGQGYSKGVLTTSTRVDLTDTSAETKSLKRTSFP